MFRLITYESGQILILCYDVCTRTDHLVTLCDRARAAEIEKDKRPWICAFTIKSPRYAVAPPALTLR